MSTEEPPAARAALEAWVAEALLLRFDTPAPLYTSATTASLAGDLLEVRRRLDRVEELLARALRVRAHASRRATAVLAASDHAWDQAAVARRSAPVIRGDDYHTARERHAYANLETLEQRRQANAATELAHACDEAVEVLRLCARGLDGLRHDLRSTIHALTFESHLER